MSRGFVTTSEASIYHDTITPGLELIMQTSSEILSAVPAVRANCVMENMEQCVCV